jgi:hypothetical protein
MNRAVLGFRIIMAFFVFVIIGLILDFPIFETPIMVSVKEAQAVIGRPLTPISVGGVRRRTRRRTRRRWAIGTRMYTMPAAYTTVVYTGTNYYVIDGEYFRKYYEGSKVVYVVVDEPKKTATDKADDQTQPASTGTAEQKLLDLKNLYDKDLIDKEEYETKKKEILNSM